MKNKKPEIQYKIKNNGYVFYSPKAMVHNKTVHEYDAYLEELLSGLKKTHEMGLVNGNWSDEQCVNFIKVLFKETQAIAKELGWDNE